MHKRTKKNGLSLKKKAGFAFVAMCLFFLILEVLLTLAGTETALEQVDPYVGFEAGIPLYVKKASSDGQFLQTASNKLTYFNPQRFPENKPEGTFRIFCLGGSTTFGRPYDDSTSFCAWLREMLRAASNDREFEVINAGGISYASYRVAAVMEELGQYSPDLFIVYCGHNEFLEDRTYSDLRETRETRRGPSLLLHRTRTFQFARTLLSDPEPAGDERFMLPAEVDAILDHTAGPVSYHRDDRRRERILEHYQFNLDRMIRTARNAGANLVLVTPAANVKDFSPFKSEHGSALTESEVIKWTALVSEAAEHEARSEFDAAIDKLEAAVAIDPRHAELRYQLGLLLFEQQRFTEADGEFQAAIDNDICPLRAVSELREIVRQTAIEKHVPLVDFEAILREDCLRNYGHESPGNAYFLDHVHPTIGGNRLLATALFDTLIQMQVVSPSERGRDESLVIASREIKSRIDPQRNAQALTNLSQVLNWAGKREEAGRLAIEALEMREQHQLEEDPECLFYAAIALKTSGNTSHAKELFERVLELQPSITQARWHLARLCLKEGEFRNAKQELERLLESEPDNPRFLQTLGRVFLELEQFEAALRVLQRAKTVNPDLLGLDEDTAFAREQLQRLAD